MKLGIQYKDGEYEVLKQKAETVAKIGVAITIFEIIPVILFKQVLFSMWVLILTLQFFVYMATWQIRYPSTL